VQSREEIIEKLGRSPDYGSAICLAMIDTPKRADVEKQFPQRALPDEGGDYNPLDFLKGRG
jgi:hypothetical protein